MQTPLLHTPFSHCGLHSLVCKCYPKQLYCQYEPNYTKETQVHFAYLPESIWLRGFDRLLVNHRYKSFVMVKFVLSNDYTFD